VVENRSPPLTATLEVPLPSSEAFTEVLENLQGELSRHGTTLELSPQGRVLHHRETVGKVTSWEPGNRVTIEWIPASWMQGNGARIDLRFEKVPDGTRITVELLDLGAPMAAGGEELAGWFGSAMLASLFRASSPEGLGDWLTDRRVRRPAGSLARKTYADPVYHWPNFLLILDRIRLTPEDNLLEVGCGGGAFLHRALESGCRATAVDHSSDMVRLASEKNRKAVTSGVLTILEGDAEALPVPDELFTCAVMTGVIGFLPNPVAALEEIRRALRKGGRLAVFGATSALRGTPAAPEPYASRIHFFDKEEFEQLGRRAGFGEVAVEVPDMEPYAQAANVPPEGLDLFRGNGAALLMTGRKV
jgi:SAM-dependent methyltransferase